MTLDFEVIDQIPGMMMTVIPQRTVETMMWIPMTPDGLTSLSEIAVFVDMNGVDGPDMGESLEMERNMDEGFGIVLCKQHISADKGRPLRREGRNIGPSHRFFGFVQHFFLRGPIHETITVQ